MADDIVKALANNNEFVKKVYIMYEKIRNDLVVNKFDSIYKVLNELTNAIQRNTADLLPALKGEVCLFFII
jgi:hypothetical protein